MKKINESIVSNKKPFRWMAMDYVLFWSLFGLILGLDQWTKWAVVTHMPLDAGVQPRVTLVDSWVYIIHVHNHGAAWGHLSGYGAYLGLLGIFVLVSIYLFRKHLGLNRPLMQLTFALLCSGIVGNMVDRFYRGHVIDFIDVYLPGYRWPTFNIADIGITIGVVMYIILNHRKEFSR